MQITHVHLMDNYSIVFRKSTLDWVIFLNSSLSNQNVDKNSPHVEDDLTFLDLTLKAGAFDKQSIIILNQWFCSCNTHFESWYFSRATVHKWGQNKLWNPQSGSLTEPPLVPHLDPFCLMSHLHEPFLPWLVIF